MAVRTVSTAVTMDTEAQFKREMAAVNGELRTLKSEMGLVEEQFRSQANSVEALEAKDRLLRAEIAQQEEKVRALKQAVEDAAEAYQDSPEKVDKYRQSLNRAQTELFKMNRELEETDQYLDEARSSSDRCATSIDEFGNKARKAGDDLDDMGGRGGIGGFMDQLGNLKSMLAGGAVVGGLAAVKDAIFGIVEETAEYRKVMGTLETSSKAAGYSAEETSETFTRLYSVMGDTQAAAEATTQLQSLGLTQDKLNELTDVTIGAWVAMGQSAPIESIAEAVQQTINAGQATGAFSDLLVMAGVSEDEFNAKLAECQTESERFNMVMQELARQGLAETGRGWIENNQDIVKMNESTAKMDAAMGELGEALAPVAAGLMNMGANAISKVLVPAINTAIDKTKQFISQMRDMHKEMREAGGNLTGQGFNADAIRQYSLNGSHAGGLAYVPYDGYLAELHEGERILTAAENRMLSAMGADLSIPQPSTMVDSRLLDALQRLEGSGQPQEITIINKNVLDGKVISQTVTRLQRERDRAVYA